VTSPSIKRLLPAVLLAAGLLLPGLVPQPAWAASFTDAQRAEIVAILRDALTKDPTILRDAIDVLQTADQKEQEAASHAALAAHAGALVDPADPVAGNPKGDVTIVEFFDTHCPFCRQIEAPMAELMRKDGGIRLVYKDMPVLGPGSMLGAKALLAAQAQGHYEQLRDVLMSTDGETTKDSIRANAQKIGLDWTRLAKDMDSLDIDKRLQKNLQLAAALGIEGTPALVIGTRLIPGAIGLEDMRHAVAEARAARKK
jgi:protein-disulfide isomerase